MAPQTMSAASAISMLAADADERIVATHTAQGTRWHFLRARHEIPASVFAELVAGLRPAGKGAKGGRLVAADDGLIPEVSQTWAWQVLRNKGGRPRSARPMSAAERMEATRRRRAHQDGVKDVLIAVLITKVSEEERSRLESHPSFGPLIAQARQRIASITGDYSALAKSPSQHVSAARRATIKAVDASAKPSIAPMSGLPNALDRAGVSLREIEGRSGLKRYSLSRFMKQASDPEFRVALRITRALGVTLDKLVGRDWPAVPLPLSAGDEHPLATLARSRSTSVVALGIAAGLTPAFVWKVSRGHRSLSVSSLTALARVGTVSADDLAARLEDWAMKRDSV